MSFTNIQKILCKNMKKLIKTQVENVFIFQPSININSHISSFKFVEYCKEELEFQQPLNTVSYTHLTLPTNSLV